MSVSVLRRFSLNGSVRSLATCAVAMSALAGASAAPNPAVPPLSVLTIGGGPNYSHNQVAIESNVRYMSGLLSSAVPHTILFTDGATTSKTVQYRSEGTPLTTEEQVFRRLFRQSLDTSLIRYRAPQLPRIDGAAQHRSIEATFGGIAASGDKKPLLLYFTGHGSRSQTDVENNDFNLWGESGLTVQELSAQIAKLPQDRPVTLLMVQCFSGAFGNVLFEGGIPTAEPVQRPLCGFFATTKDRVAAGCTPEVNEAYYRDFSSYFLGALTGRDRLGKEVAPPDYDRNGRVGMDEAFAYAMIVSPSIDVPVSTSDVFLRRFIVEPDEILVSTPYERIRSLASPAQRAALDGISRVLGDESPDRLKKALDLVRSSNAPRERPRNAPTGQQAAPSRPSATLPVGEPLQKYRALLEEMFSGLSAGMTSPQFAQARECALDHLKSNPDLVKQIQETVQSRRNAPAGNHTPVDTIDRVVLSQRLLRVAKTVLLEEKLRASGDATRIAQFIRLRGLESGNPFR